MRQNFKSEKGMTLVEVVISIGVLGIIAAAIAAYFIWAFGVFNYTNVRATEESLARSHIEYIKSQPWSGSGTYLAYTPVPANYSVTFNAASISANNTALQLISVNVTRTYSSQPGQHSTQTVTLNGYKANR